MNLRLILLKAGLKSCLSPFDNIKNNNAVKIIIKITISLINKNHLRISNYCFSL